MNIVKFAKVVEAFAKNHPEADVAVPVAGGLGISRSIITGLTCGQHMYAGLILVHTYDDLNKTDIQTIDKTKALLLKEISHVKKDGTRWVGRYRKKIKLFATEVETYVWINGEITKELKK